MITSAWVTKAMGRKDLLLRALLVAAVVGAVVLLVAGHVAPALAVQPGICSGCDPNFYL